MAKPLQSMFSLPFLRKSARALLREKVAFFQEHGYVIFEKAVPLDLIDRFWADVDLQIRENPALTFSVLDKIFTNAERPNVPEAKGSTVLRIIDIECHSALAPRLFFHRVCVDFLTALYGGAPTCLQTLTYEHSSQQAAHSDKFLVSPPTVGPFYDRETLAASWIACEDADESNDALVIYPGSHLLPKKRLGDDIPDYGAYVAHLSGLCAEAGIAPKTFNARKGDILFWHGDFVHAGGPIRDRGRTRKSLVSHYAQIPDDHAFVGNTRTRKHEAGGSYYG